METTFSFNRILCPVDFSEGSNRALQHAVALAAVGHGSVTVLHVTPLFPATTPEIPYWPLPTLVETEDSHEVAAALKGLVEEFKGLDADIQIRTAVGLPEVEAVKAALTLRADLLVLGTRGASGLGRFLLGSLTEKLLREHPCPVLAVNPRLPEGSPRVPFQRVLCPIDLLEGSAETLRYASALARAGHGTLTVLHAVDISSERLGVDVSPIPEYSVYRLEDARARLDRVVCDTLPGASVNEIVVAGTAHQAIVRLSEDFDVVVVGAHGPRPLHDIFLGSTAAHVVRAAACPVLALPGGLEARAAARTRDIESALAS